MRSASGTFSLPGTSASPHTLSVDSWQGGELSCPSELSHPGAGVQPLEVALGQKHCSRETHVLISSMWCLNWYFQFQSGFCHQTKWFWNHWAFIQQTTVPGTALRASGAHDWKAVVSALHCSQSMGRAEVQINLNGMSWQMLETTCPEGQEHGPQVGRL